MAREAAAITIGCRLNQADSALILDALRQLGFKIVDIKSGHSPSVIILNSCSVTSSASQKSRQSVRHLRREFPKAFIIVTGCSLETEKKIWENEFSVDLFLPNMQKHRIKEFLLKNREFAKLFLSNSEDSTNKAIDSIDETVEQNGDNSYFKIENLTGHYVGRSRANIKIQEGCDAYCTYCIVPYGRGTPRSRELNDIKREFKELLKLGHKEIVLTGVNIATYNYQGMKLADLLFELSKIEGDFRIRLSSTEPKFNNYELIEVISDSEKICNFLHLPIQHGDNLILKRMGRYYTREKFKAFLDLAIEKIPDMGIGSDVIVGFPGESEEMFKSSKICISSLPISFLHVFRYSKREGTPAASFPDQVDSKLALSRHKEMDKLSYELSRRFIENNIGKNLRVLFERVEVIDGEKYLTGWSDNYIKFFVKCDRMGKNEDYINSFFYVKALRIFKHRAVHGEFIS